MSDNTRRGIPIFDHGEQATLDYVKDHFDENRNQARKSPLARIAWNRQMALGNHWTEPACLTKPGAGTYHFNNVWRNGDKNLVRVTDNMIGEGIKNLTDRITRKQYEPMTRANTREPELEAAAKLRRDILLHDMRRTKWKSEIDRTLVNGIITDGPGFGRVFWDETYAQMMTVSSTEAQKCNGCGSTLSAPSLSIKDMANWGTKPGSSIETLMSRGEQQSDGGLTLGACPKCETAEVGKLAPYNPTPEEAEGGQDFFGRPLGSKVFKGEPIWEVPTPDQIYPENGGFINPRECKVMGQATIRPMSWVEARVEPDVFRKIQPEDAHELMKHHPTLGHQWFGNGRKASDENTFNNHVRVYEISVQPMDTGGEGPNDGLRWGRFIRVIQGKLCKNEPLMREVPGTDDGEGKPKRVAISQYYVSGAIPVSGQMWYRTPVDDARMLNIRLNRLLSMQDDIAARGIPIVATPEGIEWEAVRDEGGGAYRRYTYNANAVQDWDPRKSIVYPNNGAASELQPQIDDTRERIQQQLGPMPIEAGEAGGADSAIQAQLQAEQAAQKLNQIDEARVHIEEGMLQGYADMIWAFRREGGEYELENEAGEFEKASYDRNMLLGEAKIELEAKGTTDESLLQAEKSKQAQESGLYGDPTQWDQETIDDLLELRGLPKLNNVQSIQLTTAKAAWSEFIRDKKVPYIDTTIQDTWIWYQVLGKFWQGDKAKELQREIGWDEILRKLAGWERRLLVSEAQDEAARAVYEGHPPEMWGQIENEFNAKAQGVADAGAKVAGATGAPAPPPQMAPKPPANGQFLPEALCDRILMLWRAMLGTPAGTNEIGQPLPPAPLPDLYNMDPAQKKALEMEDAEGFKAAETTDAALRMYAVIQECRLDAAKKGMGIPAAPGGSATPSGGVPTPGAPVSPAAGVPQQMAGAA